MISKGSHVRRNDGLVHQVRLADVGVTFDGSPDLWNYLTSCDDEDADGYVPFGETVSAVKEDVTCLQCVASLT